MKNTKKLDLYIIDFLYAYLFLPIFLFFIGWCKWYISLPALLILFYSLYQIRKEYKESIVPFEWNGREIKTCMLVLGLIVIWVYLSGIGGIGFQNGDHLYRNAIYEILVDYQWPVVSELKNNGNQYGLIYYIGFWLPSAAFGKVFGITAGYYFQCIWAIIGIFFFYYLVCCWRRKIELWPLAIFILFSGLDIVGYFLTGNKFEMLDGFNHLEWWSEWFQFSSFTTQLFWVFNQAIPAWIITILILLQKNNKKIVLLWGSAMLYSTLPFIGMLPFLLYLMFSRNYEDCKWGKKDWRKSFIKDSFSFENILGGGIVGIVSFIYLLGNASGANIGTVIEDASGANVGTAIEEAGGQIVNATTPMDYFLRFLLFFILEVLLYYILIFKDQKKNPLFYIAFSWLAICAFVRVGYEEDFCMRASIPALIVLFLLLLQSIEKAWKKQNEIWKALFVIVFTIGSLTAIFEINRSIFGIRWRNMEETTILGEKISQDDLLEKNSSKKGFERKRVKDEDVLGGGNFSGGVEENYFFKYIAK